MLARGKLLPMHTEKLVNQMHFNVLVFSSSEDHLQLGNHRGHDYIRTPLERIVLAKLAFTFPSLRISRKAGW